MDSGTEIVPRLREDGELEPPFGGKLDDIEPKIMPRFSGRNSLDIPRKHMHPVQCRLTVIKPGGRVITR